MSNDNKTLADVQPGGRVRLGDALPPLPPEVDPVRCMIRGEGVMAEACDYYYTAEQMRDYARAALSAQPSPGGQGDTLLESLVARWRNHAEEIGVSDNLLCQKIANCTMRHAAELQAVLAARQPVGALPQGCDACDQTGIRQNDEGRNICCPACDLGSACAGDTRQPVGRSFQDGVAEWMGQCFLPSLYSDMTERGDRLLEEVLELLQAHGYDKARVPTLVDYVFGRPVGEPAQEVGGVMVTLAGYCWVAGLDMHAAGDAELARISQPEVMAKIRAKQEAKNALHFDTPLPGNAAAPTAQAVDLADFKALYRAYVRLLESGRDRIRDLGGTCDPVDVMEANDVDLQAARRVIDSQAVGNG